MTPSLIMVLIPHLVRLVSLVYPVCLVYLVGLVVSFDRTDKTDETDQKDLSSATVPHLTVSTDQPLTTHTSHFLLPTHHFPFPTSYFPLIPLNQTPPTREGGRLGSANDSSPLLRSWPGEFLPGEAEGWQTPAP